ncbi:hypothetical protein CDD83_2846 [Cordyceps sp. RAO-2017]|nr:hypothetical protein CDD83_2846 [Cordyceps sp. RAO-2017]
MVRPLWTPHVDRFCHQCLQLEPAPDYPPAEVLRLAEAQDALYTRLFADRASLSGTPERYRARLLKELVARIEAAIEDWDEHAVSDDLMSALSLLLGTSLPPESASVRAKCIVTYHLSLLSPGDRWDEPGIRLREKRSLISACGTTGLRTWEAALHLGQYLCLHPDVVAGKRVLELGAGTGYLSILCAKYLSATHAVVSDGSDEVVDSLTGNFRLNVADSARLSPRMLRWGRAQPRAQEGDQGQSPVDVVLGADITYDDRAMPALVETIVDLMGLSSGAEVYIAATQRNERTFATFLEVCGRNGLDVEDITFPVTPREQQRGPFYENQVAIRICRLLRV